VISGKIRLLPTLFYQKKLPSANPMEEMQRAKDQRARAKALSPENLRRYLRDGEGETTAGIPPIAGPVTARAQPATTVIAARAQEAWIAIGILDGLVENHDPIKTHGLQLLVREHFPDEARNLGVGLGQLPLVGILSDLAGDAVAVRKQHSLEHRDFGRDAIGGLEIRGAEHTLGVISDAEVFLLEALDPTLAGGAIGGNGEINHSIFLAPATCRFGDHELVREELLNAFLATELVPHCFNTTQCDVRILHDTLPFPTVSRNFSLPIG